MATTSEVSPISSVDQASAAVATGVDLSKKNAPSMEGSPQPVPAEMSPEHQNLAPATGVVASETASAEGSFSVLSSYPENSGLTSDLPPLLSVPPQPDSTVFSPENQDSTPATGVLSSGMYTPSVTVSPQPVSTGNQPENQDFPPAVTPFFSSTMTIPSATASPQPAASSAIFSAIATPSATVSPQPVAIGVSPENQGCAQATGVSSGMAAPSLPNSNPAKKRGRPMGSRNKPKKPKQNIVPQDLGNLVASSGGLCFTPHIFVVPAGEDITGKIIALSQQGIHGVSVLSATGIISIATLRRTSPITKITYEGEFEIVALAGSLTPTNPESDDGSRLGCLTIQFAGPDAEVVGGLVGGQLIAASPVQVVVGSYSQGEQNPEPEQATSMPDELY